MSGNCKIVKGLSLLGIVYGIVQIVVGAICFFGAADVAGMVGIDDPVITAQVLGVVLAVSGVFLIVTGFVGARGANRALHRACHDLHLCESLRSCDDHHRWFWCRLAQPASGGCGLLCRARRVPCPEGGYGALASHRKRLFEPAVVCPLSCFLAESWT